MAASEEGSVGRGLVQRASDLGVQVWKRLEQSGRATSPTPADFARELLLLNEERFRSIGHSFPLNDLALAFWYLVPVADR